ncbi:MAG: RNA polymerase sigma factor [bacterium]
MPKTDAQLVEEYLNGTESAFAELTGRYLKTVHNFAYYLSRDKNLADEIAQETFIKIWKNLAKFKQEGNFKTWLLIVARNTALDWLRKRKAIAFSEFENEEGSNYLEENIVDLEALPDEAFEEAERNKVLEKLLLEVPMLYREVLLLHYQEEMTFEEIAKVLKRPVETVKSQHRRALILLRKRLN